MKNIEFNKNFYVLLLLETEDEEKYPLFPIKTLHDLRENLLSWLNFNKDDDFTGWCPEDYTIDNIGEFEEVYNSKEQTIKNGSLEQLLIFIKENNITLSYEHPKKLKSNDFEDADNPKLVDLLEVQSLTTT